MKRCPICGEDFEPRWKQKYCGKACAIKANTIARRENPERWKRHRENASRYQQENREKCREYKNRCYNSKVEERTCPVCGDVFTVKKHDHSGRECCSLMCTHYAKHGEWPQSRAVAEQCDACGKHYIRRGNTHGCSPTCRTGLTTGEWPKSRVRFGVCPVCGRHFAYGRHAKRDVSACSHECRAALLFPPDQRNKGKRWRCYSTKKRLRIYERDNWTCQICGEPVDASADPQRGDWYPTLDHIVPRSHGGSDEDGNLRCAHRWCNAVRGNESKYTEADLRIAVVA